jgi:hypothetical protein
LKAASDCKNQTFLLYENDLIYRRADIKKPLSHKRKKSTIIHSY